MITLEEHARMNELCKRIQEEQDPQKFSKLLEKPNALLESKEDEHPRANT